jgi:hypothetical protein
MFKILLPAIASLGLVAFAAKTQPVAFAAETAPDSGQMAWHLSQEGKMAKLAYGVADSGDLVMMVTCSPNKPEASIYGDLVPEAVKGVPSDPVEGSKVALTDAGLQALAARGALKVVGDSGSTVLRASREERYGIGQFLAYCGG